MMMRTACRWMIVLGLLLTPANAAELETRSVDSTPSRVTLKVSDAAPRTVFDAIAEQGGCSFTPNPAGLWSRAAEGVSLDLEDQPFWVAMKQACGKTGIYPTVVDRRKLTLTAGNRGWLDGPSIESNGFLVVGVQAMRVNTVRLANPGQTRREVSVQLVALSEPKFRVLRAVRPATLEEAVDEQGQSLLGAGASPINVSGGPFAWNMELRLAAPPQAGQRIARLRGTVTFSVQSSAQVWTIDDVLSAANLSRTVGRQTLTIAGVAQHPSDPAQYTLRITATAAGRGDMEAIQHLMHPACLDLLDAAGTAFTFRGWTRAVDKQQVEYAFTFAQPPSATAPARLVWEIPAEMREVSVPFEFTDLPLP